MHTKVSVIVPTFNGEKKISILLNALRAQTFQDFELIVVIDGSTDQTYTMVESAETTFQKKIITQANQGRSVVKNNGAKHAHGDILIFYDDDMQPEPESILKHVNFHQKYVGLLSGNSIELMNTDKPDIQNYKAGLGKKWTEKYSDGLNELNKANIFFTAANCSIPRNLFNTLNGFDNRLTDAEDYDLATRGLSIGTQVFFDKGNVAIHHDPITCVGYIKRQREYNRAQKKISVDVGEKNDDNLIETSKRILYAPFAFAIFPRIIDSFNVFLIFPKWLRYKLYSVVIHSLARVYPNVPL